VSEPMTFQKKSRREQYIVRDDVVEATGVEPVSENPFSRLSTSVAGDLNFPHTHAQRQACKFGSLKMRDRIRGCSPVHVHRLNDALYRSTVVRVGRAA
jgi:hypothetical protein